MSCHFATMKSNNPYDKIESYLFIAIDSEIRILFNLPPSSFRLIFLISNDLQ